MHKHLVINDKVEVLTRFCLLGIRIKKDSLINFRQPLFYAYCYFKNFSEYAILRGLKKLIRQPQRICGRSLVRAFRGRTLPSAACRLAVEAGRSAAVRGRAGVRVQRRRRLCGPPA